jgi:hypothetical protein
MLGNKDRGKSLYKFSIDPVYFYMVFVPGWLNLKVWDTQIQMADFIFSFWLLLIIIVVQVFYLQVVHKYDHFFKQNCPDFLMFQCKNVNSYRPNIDLLKFLQKYLKLLSF